MNTQNMTIDTGTTPVDIDNLPEEAKKSLLRALLLEYLARRMPSPVWLIPKDKEDLVIDAFLAAGIDEMCRNHTRNADRKAVREAYANWWLDADPCGWLHEDELEESKYWLKAVKDLPTIVDDAGMSVLVMDFAERTVRLAEADYSDALAAYENHVS